MLSRVQTGGTRFMTMMTKMLQATVMMALAHHSSCNFLGMPSGEGLPAVAGLPLHSMPGSAHAIQPRKAAAGGARFSRAVFCLLSGA